MWMAHFFLFPQDISFLHGTTFFWQQLTKLGVVELNEGFKKKKDGGSLASSELRRG